MQYQKLKNLIIEEKDITYYDGVLHGYWKLKGNLNYYFSVLDFLENDNKFDDRICLDWHSDEKDSRDYLNGIICLRTLIERSYRFSIVSMFQVIPLEDLSGIELPDYGYFVN